MTDDPETEAHEAADQAPVAEAEPAPAQEPVPEPQPEPVPATPPVADVVIEREGERHVVEWWESTL
jgi:hypothetical protein